MKVTPAGNVSVRVTPDALAVPLLETPRTYDSASPAMAGSGESALVTERSGAVIRVSSVVKLSAGSESGSLAATLTVLVIVPAIVDVTTTETVADDPGLRSSRSQVISPPDSLQVP